MFWHLSEIIDESDGRFSFQWIGDGGEIDRPFIEEVMEDIVSLDCSWALLLVSEHQVDPLVKVAAHVIAFERLRVK